MHRDKMISLLKINLAEDGAADHLTHEIHHVRQRIRIWVGNQVEAAEIDPWPSTAVFLSHHMQW
jgi:hypothetical protein